MIDDLKALRRYRDEVATATDDAMARALAAITAEPPSQATESAHRQPRLSPDNPTLGDASARPVHVNVSRGTHQGIARRRARRRLTAVLLLPSACAGALTVLALWTRSGNSGSAQLRQGASLSQVPTSQADWIRLAAAKGDPNAFTNYANGVDADVACLRRNGLTASDPQPSTGGRFLEFTTTPPSRPVGAPPPDPPVTAVMESCYAATLASADRAWLEASDPGEALRAAVIAANPCASAANTTEAGAVVQTKNDSAASASPGIATDPAGESQAQACVGPYTDAFTTLGPEWPVCGPPTATVTVTAELTLRVTADHGPCRFTGKTAVQLVTGAVAGPPLPLTTVDLAAGDTVLQPYEIVLAPPCPAPAPDSPTTVDVQLDSEVVSVEVGQPTAHLIGCVTLQAGQPSVERSAK